MKRLLFKSIVVMLSVFFIGNYLIYLKTGQMPLRDLRERMGDDWLVNLRDSVSAKVSPEQWAADANAALDTVSNRISAADAPAVTKVYKWTDENGQVHFGDKAFSSDAVQIEVSLRNAISPPEAPVSLSHKQSVDAQPSAQESALDKARAAAEAMRQRVQQQEQVQ